MEPTIVRGSKQPMRRGYEGITANVLVDPVSVGSKNVATGFITFNPGSKTTPHTRDVDEVIYVLEGSATIISSGHRYTFTKGDSIFIPAGVEHQHLNEGQSQLSQLYIFAPAGPEQGVRKWPEV
jgi:quercetin dioxygenase-like cupin family protein